MLQTAIVLVGASLLVAMPYLYSVRQIVAIGDVFPSLQKSLEEGYMNRDKIKIK